ncbi:hypothetical protein CH341_13810 [Rhodoplanes roseus]|uniref:HTH luxR-type domain-containing protein n=2 Tax=Rhodoplanes roseus TaxID=29409 RepID=A0A327KXJ1_9BRAD|nr:hypothetical protein CH341_13810 [Rhodoplanes roseus]
MAGLLPVESAVDMASGASFPDESVFGIEVILQAIEQAMQSVIATNAVRVSPSADPATEAGAEQDAIVQLLGLLTPRQREILKLIGVGKSNTEIAALLGISMNTAKLHVSAILRRLDLDSRLQAVALGARIASDRF